MPTSLIRGKYIICRAGSDAESSTVIANGAVFQRDGVIEQVGTYEDLKASCNADEEIGGPNYVVFPGLVNSHHHGRGVTSLQMGYCDNSLETWILNGWTRRPHDHYLMTLFTAMQMIESGTTTVMYNHGQTPAQGLEDDLNEVLRAFDDVGMRTAFSVYYRDRIGSFTPTTSSSSPGCPRTWQAVSGTSSPPTICPLTTISPYLKVCTAGTAATPTAG